MPKGGPKSSCTFSGCGRPNSAFGLCNSHRTQQKRGKPLSAIGSSQAGTPASERMEGKFIRGPGCWLWTASVTEFGYGKIGVGGDCGWVGAHRVMWEMTYGPIPEGMHVCHTCDTPPCVNPSHLFLGTHGDNMRDMRTKKRGFIPSPTDPASRLEGKFTRGPGCWEWLAAKDKHGSGFIGAGGFGNGWIYAHRLMWEIYFGDIPDGAWVRRTCGNNGCVCPEHLTLKIVNYTKEVA